MRCLLVAPQYVEKIGDHYDFPLGLAYVSASLKKSGAEVVCLNLNHHGGDIHELLGQAIRRHGIELFCTGGLSVHYHKIKELLRIAKGIKKEIITIVGGGLISSEPHLMMEKLQIDFGVIGEGEETIIELVEAIRNKTALESVLGIIYRSPSGEIVRNKKRPPIQDLDSLPFPDYEGFEIEQYFDRQLPNGKHYFYPFDKPRLIPVISSRSCPFNCTFCFHPLGKQYRKRSHENFFHEVSYLVGKYAINSLVILDELFSLDPERAKAFSVKMRSYHLKWIAQFRVDQVDREILTELKKSGLFYISYGLESASNKILRSMNKKTCVEDIEKALSITKEMKIGIQGNFLFGDPAETMETADETLEWWKRHHYYNINLSQVIPFPGSKLYDYCVENRIIKDRLTYIEQGCPAINMTGLHQRQFSQLYDKIGDYFSAYRNFGEIHSLELECYDERADKHFYTFVAKCPHCETVNTYRNFHVNSIDIFKIGCKHCNQRYDVHSSVFTHVAERLQGIKKNIDALQEKKATFSFSPCLHVNHFLELMQMIRIEWQQLNIRYFIDLPNSKSANRYVEKGKFVGKYMEKYDILERTNSEIETNCGDHIFVVLPSPQARYIVKQLTDSLGISDDRIVEIA